MPTPPPDTPEQNPTPATPRLFGSKAADIVAGIIAAGLWWGLVIAAAKSYPRHSGPISGIIFCLFASQLIAVGISARGAVAFVLTQILTAILLPLLAIGLLFGACLLSSGGFH